MFIRKRWYNQKFPDWVDNEIHACLWYYSLRSNTKDYGGKTHYTGSQNSLVAESCTISSSHCRRPVRKLLDTSSYGIEWFQKEHHLLKNTLSYSLQLNLCNSNSEPPNLLYLSPRTRLILEKLTVTQLVKKLSAFYGTRRFVTVVTRASHSTLSEVKNNPVHPSQSVTISTSYLYLDLTRCIFPSIFPTMIFMHFLFLPWVLHAPHRHPPRFHHPSNIWWSVQVTKIFATLYSPPSHHFLPLRSKYSLSTLF